MTFLQEIIFVVGRFLFLLLRQFVLTVSITDFFRRTDFWLLEIKLIVNDSLNLVGAVQFEVRIYLRYLVHQPEHIRLSLYRYRLVNAHFTVEDWQSLTG